MFIKDFAGEKFKCTEQKRAEKRTEPSDKL